VITSGKEGVAAADIEQDGGPKAQITDLLAAWRQGDSSAMDRLMPLVYDDLRTRAHQQLARSGAAGALNTTGLVHEAYLKLVRAEATWEDRNHFFAVAVTAMRNVIVDYARRRTALKRGGATREVSLDDTVLRVEQDAEELLAIHQALDRLAVLDGRLAGLVELRFFGGLSVEEAAEVLGVSVRTVKRDWSKARTLLHGLLQAG
jgi:RNA polymerase sigma factor (TIGR02999 family)